jgi:hypothetical protein
MIKADAVPTTSGLNGIQGGGQHRQPCVPSPQPGGAPVGEAGVVRLLRRRDRGPDCMWTQSPCGVDGNGQGFHKIGVGLIAVVVCIDVTVACTRLGVTAAVALVFAVVPGEGEREPTVFQLLVTSLDRAARTGGAATRVNGITLPPFRSSEKARVVGARASERRYTDVEVELIIKL